MLKEITYKTAKRVHMMKIVNLWHTNKDKDYDKKWDAWEKLARETRKLNKSKADILKILREERGR